MKIPGYYVSGRYNTDRNSFTSSDIYWFDIPIGSIEKKYLSNGWSDWRWASGSAIGDRMNIHNSEDYGNILDQVNKELRKQLL